MSNKNRNSRTEFVNASNKNYENQEYLKSYT